MEIIEKLPPPSNVKAVRSFVGHARFYFNFLRDFFKIAKPLIKLLNKYVPFDFSHDCLQAFETLKRSQRLHQSLWHLTELSFRAYV